MRWNAPNASRLPSSALAAAFRSLPIPVIGHIKDGALVLDLRCLDDEEGFLAQLAQLPARLEGNEAAP